MKHLFMMIVLGLAVFAVPTLAQEGDQNRIAFNDFSFSVDSTLAENVNITQYPGDPAEFGPGFAEPAHTQFTFYSMFPVPESLGDAIGGVRVYRTADFTGFKEHENRLGALQALLDERPDLADFEALHTEDMNANVLPFIPVYPAAQVMRARTQYIETDEVQGIAYLTIYQETVEPFERALWTFQGISTDGAYYVAAIINVTSDVLPEDSSDFDRERFNEYRAKMAAWLDEAEPTNFEPQLPALEEMVQTFTFEEGE